MIGIVAQLIKRKGHRFLIDAMPQIVTSHPQAHLLIFGEGALADEIQRQTQKLGLEDSVSLVGFRQDLDRVLPYLDVLVHPATMEGLGNGLLQAACACVPIVASNVGGLPEVVRDEVNGLLVPPCDSKEIAQAVCRLLSDGSLRAEMGRQGKELVQREFSMDTMVAGNLAVYCDLLDIDRPQLHSNESNAEPRLPHPESLADREKHAA